MKKYCKSAKDDGKGKMCNDVPKKNQLYCFKCKCFACHDRKINGSSCKEHECEACLPFMEEGLNLKRYLADGKVHCYGKRRTETPYYYFCMNDPTKSKKCQLCPNRIQIDKDFKYCESCIKDNPCIVWGCKNIKSFEHESLICTFHGCEQLCRRKRCTTPLFFDKKPKKDKKLFCPDCYKLKPCIVCLEIYPKESTFLKIRYMGMCIMCMGYKMEIEYIPCPRKNISLIYMLHWYKYMIYAWNSIIKREAKKLNCPVTDQFELWLSYVYEKDIMDTLPLTLECGMRFKGYTLLYCFVRCARLPKYLFNVIFDLVFCIQ